uniref:Uncharacterized protein n=1 Tax=Oryza brachyantha TaxID=4533 RepID=J3LI58_ORYBR
MTSPRRSTGPLRPRSTASSSRSACGCSRSGWGSAWRLRWRRKPGSSARARLQSAMASAGRPDERNASVRLTRQAVAKWRTASAGRPASSATTATAHRRSRSFTCARSCDTDSASLGTVPDAAPDLEALRLAGTDMALAVRLEGEKLSSDQHTLSRRNAAEARRRPVWSSAAASSINPRWKQAWPKIKYLHWVSAVVFLEKPATTRCFSSEMSKQQRKRVAPELASERVASVVFLLKKSAAARLPPPPLVHRRPP